MKTCSRCKQDKPLDHFHKSSRMKDGVQSSCKSCMAESYTRSRKAKQDHYQDVAKQRRHKNVDLMREWKESKGCHVCKEDFGPCLELHHLDPSEKEGDPAAIASMSFSAFLQEAEKCVVLCANCHRKVHAGKINLGFA